jgi:hypothetical protein
MAFGCVVRALGQKKSHLNLGPGGDARDRGTP